MENAGQGLSLIVPVFNECLGCSDTFSELLRIRDEVDFPLEIILVDDGSDDGTEKIIAEFEAKHDSVISIRHSTNQGYGSAIKTGVMRSSYDVVAITDADMTYPNERIPEFYEKMRRDNLDMVVGARVGDEVSIPFPRRFAKWILRRLAMYLADRHIPDLNSGLRVMRKSVVKKFMNILPDGFSLTTTITLSMLCSNHLVEFIPINYYQREGFSKIRPFADTMNFLQLIIRTVMWFNPLRIFIPIGLLLWCASLCVLFGSWLLLGRVMDAATAIFFLTGVIIMAIGMLADLIDKRLQ